MMKAYRFSNSDVAVAVGVGVSAAVIIDRDRRRVVKAIPPPSRCRRRRRRISFGGGGERKHTVGGRILGAKLPRARRCGKAMAANRPRPADVKEPISVHDNGGCC